jgi:hypothetical protein
LTSSRISSLGFDTNTRPYTAGADLSTALKDAGLDETSSTTVSVPQAASEEALAVALLKIGTLSAELLVANNATQVAAAAAGAALVEINNLSTDLEEARNATKLAQLDISSLGADLQAAEDTTKLAQDDIDSLTADLLQARNATKLAQFDINSLAADLEDLLVINNTTKVEAAAAAAAAALVALVIEPDGTVVAPCSNTANCGEVGPDGAVRSPLFKVCKVGTSTSIRIACMCQPCKKLSP